MNINFSAVAPYLKDPLILIGFITFLSFIFIRTLVIKGIIPVLSQRQGFSILKLILLYGFMVGLLIIILGFGIKFRELSKHEQESAINLLHSELEHNVYIASELKKNTETLANAVNIVSTILRKQDFKINSGLFPKSNIDPEIEQDPDLYNKRIKWLDDSGLLQDEKAIRRFREQNAAIVRTIDKTITTIRGLADQKGSRYKIHREAFDANLVILRKIDLVNVTDLAELYAKTSEVREKYFRIASITVEYLDAIRTYCSYAVPTLENLGSALAIERLTIRILPEYLNDLAFLLKRINDKVDLLKIER